MYSHRIASKSKGTVTQEQSRHNLIKNRKGGVPVGLVVFDIRILQSVGTKEMAEVHGNRTHPPGRHRHTGFEVQNSRFVNVPLYQGISCIINELHGV
jgi:hypothetical protein